MHSMSTKKQAAFIAVLQNTFHFGNILQRLYFKGWEREGGKLKRKISMDISKRKIVPSPPTQIKTQMSISLPKRP